MHRTFVFAATLLAWLCASPCLAQPAMGNSVTLGSHGQESALPPGTRVDLGLDPNGSYGPISLDANHLQMMDCAVGCTAGQTALAPATPTATSIAVANTWQTFIPPGQVQHGCTIQNNNATAGLCVGFPLGSGSGQTAQSGAFTCPGTAGAAQVIYLPPNGPATQCTGLYSAAIMVASPIVGAGIWGGAN